MPVSGGRGLEDAKGYNAAEANCEACQANCAELSEGGRLKPFSMLSAVDIRVFVQLHRLLRRRKSEG